MSINNFSTVQNKKNVVLHVKILKKKRFYWFQWIDLRFLQENPSKMGSNQRRQRTEFSKDEAIHDEATSVSFGVYSAEEIRKLSVVEIVNPLSFNQLGHPVPGGLYDLHMGPFTGKPYYVFC